MQLTSKPRARTVAVQAVRRKRFRVALAVAGKTQADVAKPVLGVTPFHLSRVLLGRREGSQELFAKIDRFIAKQLGEQAVA